MKRRISEIRLPANSAVFPVSRRSIDEYIDRMKMTFLSAWMTRLTFRFMLLKRAYRTDDLEKMVAQTEFTHTEIGDNELGFELWLAK